LALEWMRQGPAWKRVRAFDQMGLFCRRAVESVSYSLLNRNLAHILSSPVGMGFTDLIEANRQLFFSSNIDITDALPSNLPGMGPSADLHGVAEALWLELKNNERELQQLNMPNKQEPDKPDVRKNFLCRYYWRLLWMLEHDLVDRATREDMAVHIWAGYETHGIPELPGMRVPSILEWPCPPDINVVERYKIALFEQIIPPAYIIEEDGRRAYPSRYNAPLEEYLHIAVGRRECLELTYKDKLRILQCCRCSEFQEDNLDEHFARYARQPFYSLTWILVYVLGGTLKALQKDASWLPKWLADLIAYGGRIKANCNRLKVLNLLYEDSPQYSNSLSMELEEQLYSEDSNKQVEAGFAVLLWRAEQEAQASPFSIACPEALHQAALRGFWLLDGQRSTSLTMVLSEQFKHYRQLCLSAEEQGILLRALENKLPILNYEKSKQMCFASEETHVNNWIAMKNNMELLPEHRLAVGGIVNDLCIVMPELGQAEIIQHWIREMENDPLAAMRRAGEEVKFILRHLG